jgi:hypothetical protein
MRIVLLILTLAFVISCSPNSNDSGISTVERAKIVSIAKEAVTANDTWAGRATYKVQRNGQGWSVTVWRIESHDWLGRAQFTLGGFRDIDIDENGKVTNYYRGY